MRKGILLLMVIPLLWINGCKKSSDTTTEVLGSNKTEIGISGGSINLLDVASIDVPAYTFNEPTQVELRKTISVAKQNTFSYIKPLFDISGNTAYEVRIVSPVIPAQAIHMSLTIPSAIQISSDQNPEVYGQLYTDNDGEKDENFDIIESDYYATSAKLKFDVAPMYFSTEISESGQYEAIFIIGNTRGGKLSIDKQGVCQEGQFIGCPLTTCTVTSPFNPTRVHPVTGQVSPHRGVDFRAPEGTPVMAAATGKVKAVGYQLNQANGTGWGNYVIMEHVNSNGQRFATLYAHLKSTSVSTNQQVDEGNIIALSGKTGGVSAAHLHLEYIENADLGNKNARVDPYPLINTSILRFNGAAAQFLGVNDCDFNGQGLLGSSWTIKLDFGNPDNFTASGATVTFQDVEPVVNNPYTVPLTSLGRHVQLNNSTFCAHYGNLPFFKVKAYVTLANGSISNCIYFMIKRPSGAEKQQLDDNAPRGSSKNI